MTLLEERSELQRVLAVSNEEVDAIRDGDINRYLAILADDAVFLPPNVSPKSGDELRHWLTDFLQRVRVEWTKFIHEETVAAGDLAYHRYSYSWRVTPRSGGETIVGQGKALQILRRGEDGRWKLSRSIWNANPADLAPQ